MVLLRAAWPYQSYHLTMSPKSLEDVFHALKSRCGRCGWDFPNVPSEAVSNFCSKCCRAWHRNFQICRGVSIGSALHINHIQSYHCIMPDCSKSPTFDRPHMAAIHDLDVQAMGHAVTRCDKPTNQAACSMKHGSIGARLLRLHQVCWHIC